MSAGEIKVEYQGFVGMMMLAIVLSSIGLTWLARLTPLGRWRILPGGRWRLIFALRDRRFGISC